MIHTLITSVPLIIFFLFFQPERVKGSDRRVPSYHYPIQLNYVGEIPVTKFRLENVYHFPPVRVIRIFLLCCFPDPFAEVFCLHTQWASEVVHAESSHRPGDLIFVRERVHSREGGRLHCDGLAHQ